MQRLWNQRVKHLLLLSVAQIGGIAVGLWLHYSFAVAELNRTAEQQVSAEVGAAADELLQAIGRLDLSSDPNQSAKFAEVAKLFQASRPLPDMQLTLTDSQWRVLATFSASDTTSAAQKLPERTLAWTALPNREAGEADDSLTGAVATPEGRQAAFARRLSRRGGYAVIRYPVQRAKVTPASVASLLWGVGMVTWVLTSVLLLIPVYLINTKFYDDLASSREQEEATTLRNVQSLVRTREAIIFGLAKLAQSRDDVTGQHIERITTYTQRLAVGVRHHPKYRQAVTPEFMELIGISSALHDIGKVGIEDAILLKPGRLTPDERARIEQHTMIGGNCLLEIERHLGGCNFLEMAREIAWSHHERWDGTGYPHGLSGEQIPLAARIVSIADVYDALATRRTYKDALPHSECVAIIRDGAGTQFDPDLVEVFLQIEDSFRHIAAQHVECMPEVAESTFDESGSNADWECEVLSTLETALEESRADFVGSP
ncbi:MAG TPA: HD domain-containing phosphohydrolase [Thermoguttaceae bacterium]|nr:HD domain-containing phosphohydrolase [Thermoguttaceae bacterium]